MKVLLIDPQISGISGDMLLSALIDLTGNVDIVYQISQA
ncbi:MAG TPA: DUF111 family protein, partial [Methanothermococcus okinawensis]|nr:DUF111 family protein [Methanothermococcus okinawensis]